MYRFKEKIERFFTGIFHGGTGSAASAFRDELESAGEPFERWLEHYRRRRCLYVDLSNAAVEVLSRDLPQKVERTIADAERILEHRFDLLGSGPFVPVDANRKKRGAGYVPIDWYLDPVQNLSFPRQVPHKDWDLFKMRPGNADIKLPWELARCQHFVTLGQAYRFTGDRRYADEIVNQIDDFMEDNPVGVGINWTCTMDVAIRAANWAMGLVLIKSCPDIPDQIWYRLFDCLFDHGRFIYDNFENHYEVTSNHYLSNIVGLYFISALFDELPSSGRWRTYAIESIPQEIEKQVLSDGADFESSIPYHRLVFELFLGAARLAECQGHRFSDTYYNKLEKMGAYLFGVLRPDGLMPVVGDADDGRLHILTNYGSWNRQDGRHVLAPAALMLNKRKWLEIAGPDEIWEAAWWGYDVDSENVDSNRALPNSICQYPDAGITVVRHSGDYLLISNSIVGTEGFGNHKHNDQLSFEFHCNNTPLIVDPGSHVYTSDFESRNMFRSTRYHNTMQVDDQEQNEFNPEWLFRMFEKANPETVSITESEDFVEYIGSHSGYSQLDPPLVHKRCFRYLKKNSLLMILDNAEIDGEHDLRWHFHFAPGLNLQQENDKLIFINGASDTFFLAYPTALKLHLYDGWYSASYGVKKECTCLDFTLPAKKSSFTPWFFIVGPHCEQAALGFSALCDQHRTQMKRVITAK
jgi:hypothetical protein